MQHQISKIEAEWRALHPDLPLEEMLTLIALHRAGQSMMREHEQFLIPFGLNSASADVLFSLYRAAPADGLTLAGLASVMAVTPPAMTARIDRLLESDWIEKNPVPQDRRAFKVRLTPAGRELVERILPLHIQHKQGLFSVLSDSELHTLRTLLVRLLPDAPSLDK